MKLGVSGAFTRGIKIWPRGEIRDFFFSDFVKDSLVSDPHVRVAGRSLHDIQTAKENILSALGIRVSFR